MKDTLVVRKILKEFDNLEESILEIHCQIPDKVQDSINEIKSLIMDI